MRFSASKPLHKLMLKLLRPSDRVLVLPVYVRYGLFCLPQLDALFMFRCWLLIDAVGLQVMVLCRPGCAIVTGFQLQALGNCASDF